MAQQTAVEWLMEKYNSRQVYEESIWDEEFEQAKAMEKEQIIKAYKEARQIGCKCYDDLDDRNAEPYNNKTYNK